MGGKGSSGGGGTNTVQTSSAPPAQVLQAYTDITNQATAQAATPLNQYAGPYVAGFTPQQEQAFQSVQNAQGIQDPYLNSAATLYGQSTAPVNVAGGMSGDQLSGTINQGLGYTTSAANTNLTGAIQPGVSAATQAAGTNLGASNAASLAQANTTATQPYNVAQYESPYTSQVVNATEAQLNNQNAQQAQQLTGNDISAGAFGGDRDAVAQSLLAGQQQLSEAPTIANLENSGYTNAQSEFNTQQALGTSTALNTAQQQEAAAQQQASLGASTNLSAASLGENAAATQAGLGATAASQLYGLANTQQGTQVGAQEAGDWLSSSAAGGLANVGSEAQSTALTGANALESTGAMQQQSAQEQENIPYQLFTQEQAYPFQTTGWLSNIDESMGAGSGGTSTSTQPGASLGSQVLGGAIGLAGIAGMTNGFSSADGTGPGWIQNAASGIASMLPSPTAAGGRIEHADGGAVHIEGTGDVHQIPTNGADTAAAFGLARGGRTPLAVGGMGGGLGNMRNYGSTTSTGEGMSAGQASGQQGISPMSVAGAGMALKQMFGGAPVVGPAGSAGFDGGTAAGAGMVAAPGATLGSVPSEGGTLTGSVMSPNAPGAMVGSVTSPFADGAAAFTGNAAASTEALMPAIDLLAGAGADTTVAMGGGAGMSALALAFHKGGSVHRDSGGSIPGQSSAGLSASPPDPSQSLGSLYFTANDTPKPISGGVHIPAPPKLKPAASPVTQAEDEIKTAALAGAFKQGKDQAAQTLYHSKDNGVSANGTLDMSRNAADGINNVDAAVTSPNQAGPVSAPNLSCAHGGRAGLASGGSGASASGTSASGASPGPGWWGGDATESGGSMPAWMGQGGSSGFTPPSGGLGPNGAGGASGGQMPPWMSGASGAGSASLPNGGGAPMPGQYGSVQYGQGGMMGPGAGMMGGQGQGAGLGPMMPSSGQQYTSGTPAAPIAPPGGGQYATQPAQSGGSPDIAGYTSSPGRGVAIPTLATGSTGGDGSNLYQYAGPGQALNMTPTSSYTPPSVATMPYNSISYPVLQPGETGAGTPTVTSYAPTTPGGQAVSASSSNSSSSGSSSSSPVQLPAGVMSGPVGVSPASSDSSSSSASSSSSPSPSGAVSQDAQGYNLYLLEGGNPNSQAAYNNWATGQYGGNRGGSVDRINPDIRLGRDSGGATVQAGLANTGTADATGPNPGQQGMNNRFSGMGAEQLQELAARVPAGNPQGQAIRLALQQKKMSPQGTLPQQAAQQGGLAVPMGTAPAASSAGLAPTAGMSSPIPAMASGGGVDYAGMKDAAVTEAEDPRWSAWGASAALKNFAPTASKVLGKAAGFGVNIPTMAAQVALTPSETGDDEDDAPGHSWQSPDGTLRYSPSTSYRPNPMQRRENGGRLHFDGSHGSGVPIDPDVDTIPYPVALPPARKGEYDPYDDRSAAPPTGSDHLSFPMSPAPDGVTSRGLGPEPRKESETSLHNQIQFKPVGEPDKAPIDGNAAISGAYNWLAGKADHTADPDGNASRWTPPAPSDAPPTDHTIGNPKFSQMPEGQFHFPSGKPVFDQPPAPSPIRANRTGTTLSDQDARLQEAIRNANAVGGDRQAIVDAFHGLASRADNVGAAPMYGGSAPHWTPSTAGLAQPAPAPSSPAPPPATTSADAPAVRSASTMGPPPAGRFDTDKAPQMLPHGASSETAVSENHQQPTPPVPTPRPSSASPAVAAASLVKQSEAIRKDSSAQTPATNAPTGAPAAPTFHTPDVGAGFSPALGTAPTSGVLGPDATWKPADAGDLSSLANGTHPRGKYEIDPGRSVTRNAPTQGINGTVTPWQSLATMGLGMMTGNSRNFLTNLGAGAQAGIKEYSRELAGANKQADIDFTQRQKQQRDAQQVARGNADSRYHSDSLDNTVANEAALRQAEKDRLAQSGQQWQQDYGLRSAQAGRTATQFAQEQANQALNPPGSYSKQTGPADANGNVPYTLYDSKDVPVRSYYQAGENTRGGLSLEDANTEAGKLVQNGAIPPKQFDAKVQELMGGQKPPSSPGAPVSISNKAQYDALPRGTKYTAPDGSQRVKP